MAIVKMQKLSICANKKNRKAILELLQSMGTMEMRTEQIEDPDLMVMDTQTERSQFEKNADVFEQAIGLFKLYAPGKNGGGLFSEKKMVERSEFNDIARKHVQYLESAKKVLQAEKKMNECKGLILKDQNFKASLVPWEALDIPMESTGTKKSAILIGTVPGAKTESEIFAAAAKDLEEPVPVNVNVLFVGNGLTYVTVLCLRSDQEKVEENLRAEGFARPSQSVKGIPKEIMAAQDLDIKKQEEAIESAKKEIADLAVDREAFEMSEDYYRTRAAKYRLLGTIPQSQSMFFLTGWVPKDKEERVTKILTEKFGAYVEEEEKSEDEIEPTLLHNNKFSDSAEGVLESYGLPQHGHADPTFVMSIFYVIFFGMMLSDAAYGIILSIGSAVILAKYKRMDSGMRKMLKLFFFCGISTTFWGFMYGGFFGDAIDVVAKTFFGYHGPIILKPLWFAPLNDPMRLLLWCMLFGIIHLFFGLGIKG